MLILNPPSLRICIDARIDGAAYGGTGSAVIGLARALSALTDGPEDYFFLTWAGDDAWLRPHVSGSCRILPGPCAPREPGWKRWMKERLPPVRAAWHRLIPLAGSLAAPISASDGTAERAGAHVVHFAHERAFATDRPSIYQPWDLQHLHFPEYFTPRHFLIRERTYRHFCSRARIVVVATEWVRRDLLARYGLPPEKVRVIPPASALSRIPEPGLADLEHTRRKFKLPDDFALYPAQTWPHKNHIGLLEALAILRDQRGVTVPLVCPGPIREFFPAIARRMRELRLEGQVRFPGFVAPVELRSFYRLCRCVVLPTRFEGFGLPLVEAFEAGAPAAASATPPLAETAGDAAALFDPRQPAQIAETLLQVWMDPVLRETLVRRGRERAARFSWDHAARTFRACYREVAGRPLTDGDRTLLAAEADFRP